VTQRPGDAVLADRGLDDEVELLGRDRPHRVHGGGHPEPVVIAQHADPVRPGLGVPVVEPSLHTFQRNVDPAAQVAGVQQGQPDPGRPRGVAQRLTHRVGVPVAGAAGAVVQVVELPDRGHPGEGHLGVHGGRQPPVGVRVEAIGQRVHPIPPAPEGAELTVGAPTQGPVEGVRVGVGEAGQDQPGQPVIIGAGVHVADQ
jgi:hypothetical protein